MKRIFLWLWMMACFYEAASSDISASVYEGCVPFTVSLSTSAQQVKAYSWTISNGETFTVASPSFVINTAGTYTVQLQVEYNNGTTASFPMDQPITAVTPPLALYESSTSNTCLNELIQFSNESEGATSYLWDFGDGATSTEISGSHTYSAPGTYEVTLLAYNDIGCSAVYAASESIIIAAPVEAHITASRQEVCVASEAVTFSIGAFLAYEWDFGDGSTSSEASPQHTYTTDGAYTVSVNATHQTGCTYSYVLAEPLTVNALPQAVLAVGDTTICKGNSLTFEFQESIDSVRWNFSDGISSSEKSFNRTFTSAGRIDLTVELWNTSGCQTTMTYPSVVDVQNVSAPAISLAANEGCAPFIIEATNSTTGYSAVSWLLNDQLIEGATLAKEVKAKGDYILKSITTYPEGCKVEQVVDTIHVYDDYAEIVANTAIGCAPLEVAFDLKGDVVTADWDFGNGQGSTLFRPAMTFEQAGNYAVTCDITSSKGCTKTLTYYVRVYPNGINFSPPAPISTCAPADVHFDASFGQDFWLWDFGDGQTSTEANPSHRYLKAGVYNVSLRTINSFGCETYIPDYNRVEVNQVVSGFYSTIEDTQECPNFSVRLTPDLTTESQYLWQFEDGSVSTDVTPLINFATNGQVSVRLTVWDSTGCSHSSAGFITSPWAYCNTAEGPPVEGGDLPDSLFNYENNMVLCSAPAIVHFTNPKRSASSWKWLFGDGNESAEKEPTHRFEDYGEFAVSLISYYSDGSIDTLSNFTNISMILPEVDYTYEQVAGCSGTEVAFESRNTDSESYSWSFGTGAVSDQMHPTYLYDSSGMYQVTLSADRSDGCTARAVKNIMVGNPYYSFNYPDKVCLGDTLKIEHNITGYERLEWHFSGQSVSVESQPYRVFSEAGTYSVKVVAIAGGCSDEFDLERTVEVLNPIPDFAEAPVYACNGQSITIKNTSEGASSYKWVVNQVDTIQTRDLTYFFTSGFHDVSLIAENGTCSNIITRSQYIEVDSLSADFTIDQSSDCLPFKVSFSADGYGISDYQWVFGDGEEASGQKVTHTFESYPETQVILIAKNAKGCEIQVKKSIGMPVIPDFEISKSPGCVDEPLQFVDKSQNGSILSYDLGNGATVSGSNITYSYHKPGTYTITAVASGQYGCEVSIQKTLEVVGLKADFDVQLPEDTCAPVVATFQNHSENATSFTWHFGNDKTSTGENPINLYKGGGDYSVMLIAKNDIGCTDTLNKVDLVKVNGPRSFIDIASKRVCFPAEIQFTDTSNMAVSWQWVFGDGATSTERNPKHAYEQPGIYSVSLTSMDASGCSQYLALDSIQLIPTPQAAISLLSAEQCLPATVKLDSKSQSLHNPSYQWMLNDQVIGDSSVLSYIVRKPDDYTLSLKVINDGLCEDVVALEHTLSVYDTASLEERYVYQLSVAEQNFARMILQESPEREIKYNLLYKKSLVDDQFHVCDTLSRAEFNDMQTQPDINPYQYKIQTHTYCREPAPLEDLTTYQTIHLAKTASTDNKQLHWKPYRGHDFQQYAIMRRKGEGAWQQIAQVPSDQSIFIDPETLCPGTYSYHVRALNLDGSSYYSASNKVEVTHAHSFFEEQTVEILRTTVTDDGQTFTEWAEPEKGLNQVEFYEIWRSKDAGNYEMIDRLPRGSTGYYDDQVATSEESYYYQIKIVNTCDIEPIMSNYGHSILLEKESSGYKHDLRWLPYTGWQGGVGQYLLQQKDAYGQWQTIQEMDSVTTEIVIDLSKEH